MNRGSCDDTLQAIFPILAWTTTHHPAWLQPCCFHNTDSAVPFGVTGLIGLTSALSNKGSWEVQSLLRAWRSAITRCLAKCAGCRRCAFVSISVEAKDCSWFASCGGTRLQEVRLQDWRI